jgi:3-oxoacyl-[acyl-carrier-protein] synthase-1
MIKFLKKKENEDICIVKCGMTSPLGIDSKMTAAMIMAESRRFMPHDILTDPEDKPLSISKATFIEDEDYLERFKSLLTPALFEVLEPLFTLNPKLKIFAGLPEKNDYQPPNFVSEITTTIGKIIKESPVGAETEVYCKGHSSGLICLEKAIKRLKDEEIDFCIVGGVDSYINTELIFELTLKNRIHSSSIKHGFIPGEAAGFFLVTTEKRANYYEMPVLARIKALGSTMEEKTFLSGKTCLGQGLSKAVASVLKDIPENTQIDKVYCDLNGERFRTEEYNYLLSRNSDLIEDPGSYITTSRSYGDVGAATLPGLVNLAVHHNEEKTTGLFFTGSDSGIRSAAIIEIEPTA